MARSVPSPKVLHKCVQRLYEWQVNPEREVQELPESLSELPDSGGVYILYDAAGRVLYVGKASNLQQQIRQTLRRVKVSRRLPPGLEEKTSQIRAVARYLSVYEIESKRLRTNMEALLLRVFINHLYNDNIGDFEQ